MLTANHDAKQNSNNKVPSRHTYHDTNDGDIFRPIEIEKHQ
jgi:hypothetical protein